MSEVNEPVTVSAREKAQSREADGLASNISLGLGLSKSMVGMRHLSFGPGSAVPPFVPFSKEYLFVRRMGETLSVGMRLPALISHSSCWFNCSEERVWLLEAKGSEQARRGEDGGTRSFRGICRLPVGFVGVIKCRDIVAVVVEVDGPPMISLSALVI